MAVELVVVIVVAALLVGGLIGFFVKGRGDKSGEQIAKLEAELEASQNELQDYRQEVVQQFSDTAEKFKTLDESYHALHRQLANSSVALIGDAGAPLLTGGSQPEEEAVELEIDDSEEIVVSESGPENTSEAQAEETQAEEPQAEEPQAEEAQAEELQAEELQAEELQEEEKVPTLTDNPDEELTERKIVP